MTQTPAQPHNPYARMTNLADARLGAKAIHCTDDFFADMNRMLQNHDPVWKEGVYDAASVNKGMTIAPCV
jgi:allantoicase